MLSIIIPTLNEERFLPILLDDIKAQDFKDYEIIICDGHSEDKTVEVARKYGCRLAVDSRRHPSYERNSAAKIAHGDILLFLDADGTMPPGFLSSSVAEFKQRKLDAACFYLHFDSKKISHHILELVYNALCWFRQYISPISVGVGIMVKTNLHFKVNGFDETLFIAEDYDYCKRIGKVGRFRVLRSKRLDYSIRRLDKEGTFNVALKWLKMGAYTFFAIPIKKKMTTYDFGHYDK